MRLQRTLGVGMVVTAAIVLGGGCGEPVNPARDALAPALAAQLATSGATDQDATIAGEADRLGKGIIIVANKWDLMKDRGQDFVKEFDEALRRQVKFLDYAPVLHISAQTGERASKLLEMIDKVSASRRQRVKTGDLNRFVETITAAGRRFVYVSPDGNDTSNGSSEANSRSSGRGHGTSRSNRCTMRRTESTSSTNAIGTRTHHGHVDDTAALAGRACRHTASSNRSSDSAIASRLKKQ